MLSLDSKPTTPNVQPRAPRAAQARLKPYRARTPASGRPSWLNLLLKATATAKALTRRFDQGKGAAFAASCQIRNGVDNGVRYY